MENSMPRHTIQFSFRQFAGLVVLLLIGGAVIGGMFVQSTTIVFTADPPDHIDVQLNDHAVEGHGTDAILIRECLNNNNPTLVLKSRWDKNVYFRVCQLEDGRFGIQVLLRKAGQWIEKTTFVPKDGSWAKVSKYLFSRATRFKTPLSSVK